MQPKVSIVVPVYKVEKYIDKCVQSLLCQTYDNLEIILVDDGSPDSSGHMCDDYSRIDSRVKVIHKKNGGLSDARNVAIEMANGEYIMFVDSDDYVTDNYVEYLYKLIINNKADISICELDYITEDGIQINHPLDNGSVTIMDTELALKELLDTRKFSNSASGKLYKIEFFEDIRYPVGMLYEDIGTTYKLIMKAKKIAFGSRPYYHYIRRNGSIQTGAFNIKTLEAIQFVEEMTSEIVKRYPELNTFSKCRRMDTYYSTLQIINEKEYPKEFNDIYRKIREIRLDVLTCNGCKLKRRVIAALSYLPKRLFWKMLQLVP